MAYKKPLYWIKHVVFEQYPIVLSIVSQTLRVSIFYRVVPYIQHSTVQPLLTNFLFHMKNIWSLFATWASQVVMKSIVHTK